MKNLFLISITLICVLLFSCKKEEINIVSENNEILLSDDGYLKFDSQLELTNLLEEYIAAENGAALKSGIGKKAPKGFVSIAELNDQLSSTKGSSSEQTGTGFEIEETTVEEFNVSKASFLLKDPVLCNIFDTTLRLSIGDELYKITEYGTFITKVGYEAELHNVISNFGQIKNDLNLSDVDSTIVSVSPNVKFFNSFRNSDRKNNLVSEDELLSLQANSDNTEIDDAGSTKAGSMSQWVSEYNLKSFKWESRTDFGNFWYSLFGKDITRENRYPSNARMTVELFDVNYLFYASAGIKVKVEKLKKCLFWTYWADQKATKYAIGFDKFEGEATWSFPPRKTPTLPGDKYNVFSGYFNNAYKEILYRGYHSMDFIKDWSNEIFSFVPKLDFNLPFNLNVNNIIRNQVKDIIDYPANAVYSWLNKQVGREVWDPVKADLKKQIKSKSPMALYVTWGTATQSVTRSYVNGVQEYPSADKKVIRFDKSFGITIGVLNGSFSFGPYLPTTFKIKDIDMFGAAYFEGYWRGVRMYK